MITGPESTGKTTLAGALANFYQGSLVEEFSRQYVEKLKRSYTYDDIEHIARQQIMLIEMEKSGRHEFVFIDTYLIIIKVWFLEVYEKYPKWIDTEIRKKEIDLYLLCDTDLVWIPDPVRENGGERREYLKTRYIEELESFHLDYRLIKGIGKNRLDLAVKIINDYFGKVK